MIKKLSLLVTTLVFSIAVLAADSRYILGVDGLACPFCAYGIEKRLNRIDGVTDVQVNVGESVVHVTMQEGKTLSEDRVNQAVDEAGFTLRAFSEAEDETGGNGEQ